MSAEEVQDVLERLCNLLRMETRAFGSAYGLQPVQMEALAYLTSCNRYSDTPQAVTEYLGLTKGTVSQSLQVLEQKGFLRKRHDRNDKRLIHLLPTVKGKRLVQQAGSAKRLAQTLAQEQSLILPELAAELRTILYRLQQANGRKTFEACHTCRHNIPQKNGALCGLTQEPLSQREVLLICREHEFPADTTRTFLQNPSGAT